MQLHITFPSAPCRAPCASPHAVLSSIAHKKEPSPFAARIKHTAVLSFYMKMADLTDGNWIPWYNHVDTRCISLLSKNLLLSYLHCLGRKFPSDKRERINFSSLPAPGPGLRAVVLPTTEQGSLPFSLGPMHQPPGTSIPGPRNKSSASILSSTGSSLGNFLANGALLSIMLDMSLRVR